jgi:AbrB family looped-hinge helix DNA binding protein
MIIMLAELRAKSQITIPKELVDKLGLSEGDKLEFYEQDGVICAMPVTVYPKKYLEQLREEIEEAKILISSGEQPVFDTVDLLFARLEGC